MDIDNKTIDFVIIGAGPAGIQAGYQLGKVGRDYLILERDESAGHYFKIYPRHRKLISINKVYTGYDDPEINLRWDWNSLLADEDDSLLFKEFSKNYFPHADAMVSYLQAFAEKNQVRVRYNAKVVTIRRDEHFEIELADGDVVKARTIIVATGVSQPWLPKINGIELAVPYSEVETNPERFVNRRVLILGKGNSAFETADNLVETAAMIHVCSPNPLKMAWSSHFVGHLRAVNNNFLDTYQLKSQNAMLDAQINSVQKTESGRYSVSFVYAHAEGEVERIEYDDVIACTGFRWDNTIFDESCRPALCDIQKLPVQTATWESRNVPDVYFAGTIMQYLDYKKYMSGFVHGFRYNVRTLVHQLNEKYHGVPYPSKRFEATLDRLVGGIIDRINGNSALWQQPGFLCDVFSFKEDDGGHEVVEHHCDLMVQNAHARFAEEDVRYIMLTLEFGMRKFEHPFNVSRIARDNIARSEQSNFLHPVVRVCRGGKVLFEHHVIEDLAAEWREPEHIEPLTDFLREVGLGARKPVRELANVG